MSTAAIRAVFEGALNTWATANSVPVVWENTLVNAPAPAKHVRATLLTGAGRTLTMEGDAELVGVFQVTVITTVNVGPHQSDVLCDSLAAAFNPSTPLGSSPKVWLTSPMSRGPAAQTETTYQVPMSAAYWASDL